MTLAYKGNCAVSCDSDYTFVIALPRQLVGGIQRRIQSRQLGGDHAAQVRIYGQNGDIQLSNRIMNGHHCLSGNTAYLLVAVVQANGKANGIFQFRLTHRNVLNRKGQLKNRCLLVQVIRFAVCTHNANVVGKVDIFHAAFQQPFTRDKLQSLGNSEFRRQGIYRLGKFADIHGDFHRLPRRCHGGTGNSFAAASACKYGCQDRCGKQDARQDQ